MSDYIRENSKCFVCALREKPVKQCEVWCDSRDPTAVSCYSGSANHCPVPSWCESQSAAISFVICECDCECEAAAGAEFHSARRRLQRDLVMLGNSNHSTERPLALAPLQLRPSWLQPATMPFFFIACLQFWVISAGCWRHRRRPGSGASSASSHWAGVRTLLWRPGGSWSTAATQNPLIPVSSYSRHQSRGPLDTTFRSSFTGKELEAELPSSRNGNERKVRRHGGRHCYCCLCGLPVVHNIISTAYLFKLIVNIFFNVSKAF